MNRFGRRKFCTITGKGALGAALLAAEVGTAGFLLSGCAITMTSVLNWTKVGIGAINAVMTILAGSGLVCAACAVAAPIAIAAINAIANAITEWQNAPAADKATLWGKIHTALVAAFDQVSAFFQSVTIPGGNTLIKTVIAIASLTLSTIAGFIQQFFPTLAAAAAGKHPTVGGTAPVPVIPKSLQPGDYKKQFNSIVVSGGHSEVVMH